MPHISTRERRATKSAQAARPPLFLSLPSPTRWSACARLLLLVSSIRSTAEQNRWIWVLGGLTQYEVGEAGPYRCQPSPLFRKTGASVRF